jgi:hypothetical protein
MRPLKKRLLAAVPSPPPDAQATPSSAASAPPPPGTQTDKKLRTTGKRKPRKKEAAPAPAPAPSPGSPFAKKLVWGNALAMVGDPTDDDAVAVSRRVSTCESTRSTLHLIWSCGRFEGKGVSTSRVSPAGPLSISYAHVGGLKARAFPPPTCETSTMSTLSHTHNTHGPGEGLRLVVRGTQHMSGYQQGIRIR